MVFAHYKCKKYKRLRFGNFKYDSHKIGNLVFLGVIVLPAFNEATRKDIFSISLPFLYSSEIVLFMVFFYNALVLFFKHQYKAPMAAVM